MKRREFITLLGGAAAAWPLAARAQQPAMPVIGFLDPSSPDAEADRLRGFRQGLKDTGFVDGENVEIVYRFAENQSDRLSALAAELVRRQVDVIATRSIGAFAAKAATSKVPIVFSISEDPVGLGLVASLARPGGNLTGVNFFSTELAAKRLEVMRELVPGAARVAVLVNPANAMRAAATVRDLQAATSAMGLQIQVLNAGTSHEINAAFATFVRERPDALFVGTDPFFSSRRAQLVNLASRHAVPATYSGRHYCEIGGLMSYGSDTVDALRQVGAYAGRILKGAKPADLPVVQASKFELVINAETARMLGLEVPAALARPRRRGDRMIRRREFITLLGGAAAAWPLAARAQQGERVRRIGVIMPASSDDPEYQVRVGAFLQELQRLGWTIGRNIRIDTRWTRGDAEDARKYAAELVALNPDVVIATGISTVAPLLQLTRTVPIVFPAVSDPVGCRRRRKLGAAGRQRHRISRLRVQSEREVAGAAQADRPDCAAGGDPSRSCHTLRDRSVRHYPGRGIVGRARSVPGPYS